MTTTDKTLTSLVVGNDDDQEKKVNKPAGRRVGAESQEIT